MKKNPHHHHQIPPRPPEIPHLHRRSPHHQGTGHNLQRGTKTAIRHRQYQLHAGLTESLFRFCRSLRMQSQANQTTTPGLLPRGKGTFKEEYYRLIKAAQELQKDRLSLIIQTICSTGIRISELECITVRAAQSGVAEVNCKGKSRQIFIPHKLKMMLLTYIKKQHIRQGPIFITKQGNPINRSNVWREMKNLCKIAHVKENKVFPHNLRHLFAKTYYKMEKDISKLADLLGHSSINTTRIYIISSGEEHRRQIDRMKLLL